MKFYGDHVEYDPSLRLPTRYLELIPPVRYVVDPRPEWRVRYKLADDWLREHLQVAVYKADCGMDALAVPVVTEYAHQAFCRT